VDECKPLPGSSSGHCSLATSTSALASLLAARGQGLTLAHFRAQLEDLRDTSLTFELNMGTFGSHPRVQLGHMGDKV
jgi:hypothetical protein